MEEKKAGGTDSMVKTKHGLFLLCLLFCLLISGFRFPDLVAPYPPCGCAGEMHILSLSANPKADGEVYEVQNRLLRLGYWDKPLDGIFSPALQQAIRAWQKHHGLKPTGMIGAQEWELLTLPEKPRVKKNPPEGEISIVIDLDSLTLGVYADGKLYKLYPIASGKYSTPSPIGEFRVAEKDASWHGPTGARWMGLTVTWGNYGIHGTNNPFSIGSEASAGCIRMFNEDVMELFEWVPYGTPVTIVGTRERIVSPGLYRGTAGQEVVWLQLALREAGFNPGRADGVFGEDTEKSLNQFKQFYGFAADGVADSNTLYLLGLR